MRSKPPVQSSTWHVAGSRGRGPGNGGAPRVFFSVFTELSSLGGSGGLAEGFGGGLELLFGGGEAAAVGYLASDLAE